MALETGTFISDLVATNPGASDPKSQGDDHLRLVKSTVKATFPNITGAVTPTHLELNYVAGATSALQTQLTSLNTLKAPKDTATFTGNTTLPATTVIGAVTSAEITYLSGVTSSIQTQVNAKAPLSSPVFTGTPTAPTASAGTATTQLATTAFVASTAFSAALPAQTGNAGKFVTTNGTAASWEAIVLGIGDHSVTVHTGNGRGSSNTAIPRFTTILSNVGTAITYADSATLGASFTINEAGIYEIYFQGKRSGSGSDYYFGISKNSGFLSTSIVSQSVANVLASGVDVYASAIQHQASLTRVASLSIGDVIRPHTELTDPNTTSLVYFSIRKVAKI